MIKKLDREIREIKKEAIEEYKAKVERQMLHLHIGDFQIWATSGVLRSGVNDFVTIHYQFFINGSKVSGSYKMNPTIHFGDQLLNEISKSIANKLLIEASKSQEINDIAKYLTKNYADSISKGS